MMRLIHWNEDPRFEKNIIERMRRDMIRKKTPVLEILPAPCHAVQPRSDGPILQPHYVVCFQTQGLRWAG